MFTKNLLRKENSSNFFLKNKINTCGFSATYFAHCLINLIASIDVSGNEALHANSDKHLTAS
jgi:hypothetical protein